MQDSEGKSEAKFIEINEYEPSNTDPQLYNWELDKLILENGNNASPYNGIDARISEFSKYAYTVK